jgi:hypothetical protein
MLRNILVAVCLSMSVGCSSLYDIEKSKTSIDGLKNYNISQESSLSMAGHDLYFVAFEKKMEIHIIEGGKEFKKTQDQYATGVQWNSEYAVTSKRAYFAKDIVYKCPEVCDIQFIKRKAIQPVPLWRSHVANERLMFVGVQDESNFRSEFGTDIDLKSYTQQHTTSSAFVADNHVVEGMSGAPAYALDGKVIGILLTPAKKHNLTSPESSHLNGRGEHFAVYVSYNDIKKEWDRFQSSD